MKHGNFERVDGAYLADSHARVVGGNYEQRNQPDTPDEAYDLAGKDYQDGQYDDSGIEWIAVAIVAACALIAFFIRIAST